MPEKEKIMVEEIPVPEKKLPIGLIIGISLAIILIGLGLYFALKARAEKLIDGRFICVICGGFFDTKEQLDEHTEIVHPEEKNEIGPVSIQMSVGADIKFHYADCRSNISVVGVHTVEANIVGYVTDIRGRPCKNVNVKIWQDPQELIGIGGYYTVECEITWIGLCCSYVPHNTITPSKAEPYIITTDENGAFSFNIRAIRGKIGTIKRITFHARSGLAGGQVAVTYTCRRWPL